MLDYTCPESMDVFLGSCTFSPDFISEVCDAEVASLPSHLRHLRAGPSPRLEPILRPHRMPVGNRSPEWLRRQLESDIMWVRGGEGLLVLHVLLSGRSGAYPHVGYVRNLNLSMSGWATGDWS